MITLLWIILFVVGWIVIGLLQFKFLVLSREQMKINFFTHETFGEFLLNVFVWPVPTVFFCFCCGKKLFKFLYFLTVRKDPDENE